MDHLEIEVKFCVENPDELRRAIAALGCRSLGRVFERNHCYDDSRRSLEARKALLRLRKDKAVRLTFKSVPPTADADFKVLRELEVAVDDFDTMAGILEAIGFRRTRVYEKWRETFACQQALLCLDALPMGTFLEIEGPRPAIEDLARRLHLPWQERILANYLEMFDHLRASLGLSFGDLTFDNFRGVLLDPGWPRVFAAGA